MKPIVNYWEQRQKRKEKKGINNGLKPCIQDLTNVSSLHMSNLIVLNQFRFPMIWILPLVKSCTKPHSERAFGQIIDINFIMEILYWGWWEHFGLGTWWELNTRLSKLCEDSKYVLPWPFPLDNLQNAELVF